MAIPSGFVVGFDGTGADEPRIAERVVGFVAGEMDRINEESGSRERAHGREPEPTLAEEDGERRRRSARRHSAQPESG